MLAGILYPVDISDIAMTQIGLIMKLLSICLIILFSAGFSYSQVPEAYWIFDTLNPENDTAGGFDLISFNNSSPASKGGGQVNGYLKVDSLAGSLASPLINLAADSSHNDSAYISVEFLMRLEEGYHGAIPVFWQNRFRFSINDEQIEATIYLLGGLTSNIVVPLNGIGKMDSRYYTGGDWHHFAVTYSAKNGELKVYTDGTSPPGFSKINGASVPLQLGNQVYFNPIPMALGGSLDEVALYDTILSPRMVYHHYRNTILNGNHYDTIMPDDSVVMGYNLPKDLVIPATWESNPFDFGPAYPNISEKPLELLRTYPGPRYKQGHLLPRIYPWIADWDRLADSTTFSPAPDYVTASKIQRLLVRNFNYAIALGSDGTYRDNSFIADTMKEGYQFTKLAFESEFLTIPRFLITNWIFNPTNSIVQGDTINEIYLHRENMDIYDPEYYAVNYGQPLYGQYFTREILSPAAPQDSLKRDGLRVKEKLLNLISWMKILDSNYTRLDIISENGEVFGSWDTTWLVDPVVQTDYSNSGATSWLDYDGIRKHDFALQYRNEFKGYIDSVNNANGFDSLAFQYYNTAGESPGLAKYSQFRTVNTADQYQVRRPSPYFYPIRPGNWRFSYGALNGIQRLSQGRITEIAETDTLFNPFISPGFYDGSLLFSPSDLSIIRPGQWLGLLKNLGCLGADTYTNFMYFGWNIFPAEPWPGNWRIWKTVIPAYAQAVISRTSEFLYNGKLLPGSQDWLGVGPAHYEFRTGTYLDYVTIRQHNSGNRYLITGSLQKLNNLTSHGIQEKTVGIKLGADSLYFKIRPQGSTYIYDVSNPVKPIFFQLDGWHEAKEPWHWCRDFFIEAEVFDSLNGNHTIETERLTSDSGDYSGFNSFLSIGTGSPGNNISQYSILIRHTDQSDLYGWIRARVNLNQFPDTCKVDLLASNDPAIVNSFDAIIDTVWAWYAMTDSNGATSKLTSLSLDSTYTITIQSDGCAEIEKISLVRTDTTLFSEPLIAEIAAIGGSFCLGDEIQFTDSSSAWSSCVDYLWQFGDGTRSFEQNPKHIYEYGDTFTVTLSVSEYCTGNTDVDTYQLIVVASNVDAGADTAVCHGTSVPLHGTAYGTFWWQSDTLLSDTSVLDPIAGMDTFTNIFFLFDSHGGCLTVDSVTVQIIEPVLSDTIYYLCNAGDTIHLQIPGAFYMEWDISGTMWFEPNDFFPYAAPVSTDTFTVAGTDLCKCDTKFAEVIVVVYDGPVTTNDAIICPGQEVQLNVVADSTKVSWVPVSWIQGAGTAHPVVKPSQTITYYAQIEDNLGKTCYDSVHITVQVSPGISQNVYNICVGDSVLLSANGGVSWDWDPGNKVVNYQAQSTLSKSLNTYTEFVVGIVDSNNCFFTEQADVHMIFGDACCVSPMVNTGWVFMNSTSTHLINDLNGGSGIVTDKTLSITGDFTIDKNIRFDSCLIFMAANAKIKINGPYILEINYSTVTLCGDTMWDGIYANHPNSRIEMSENTFGGSFPMNPGIIEHARNGVVISNGASHRLQNNLFENCYNNITVNQGNYGATDFIVSTQINPWPSNLKAPYLGMNSKSGVVIKGYNNLMAVNNYSYLDNNTIMSVDSGLIIRNSDTILVNMGSISSVMNGVYLDSALVTIHKTDITNSVGDFGIYARESFLKYDSAIVKSVKTAIFAEGDTVSLNSVIRDARNGIESYNSMINTIHGKTLWQNVGIEADSSTVYAESEEFENGDTAIFVKHSTLNAKGSLLKNSDRGILSWWSEDTLSNMRFENVDIGIMVAQSDLFIDSSSFDSSTVAIQANPLSIIHVDSNQFNDCKYGLETNKSDVIATRNYFKNIYQSISDPISGIAIYSCDASNPNPLPGVRTMTVGGNSQNDRNFFEDCRIGVHGSKNMQMQIRNNYFRDIWQVGVFAGTINNQTVEIKENAFDSCFTGIMVNSVNYSAVDISGNSILGDSTAIVQEYGIRALGNTMPIICPNCDGHMIIDNNDIKVRGVGIDVKSIDSAVVKSNTIRIHPRQNSSQIYQGIRVEGSKAAKVLENSLYLVDTATVKNTIGIGFLMTEEALVSCNIIRTFSKGIRFEGLSALSEIWENTINRADTGWHVLNNAIMGQQGKTGMPTRNTWLNITAPDFYSFATNTTWLSDSVLVENNPFQYPNDSSMNYSFPPKPASIWLIKYYPTTGIIGGECYDELVSIDTFGTGGGSMTAERIAGSEYDYPVFTEQTEYLADQLLFELLSNDDALRYSDTLYEYWYEDREESNIAKIRQFYIELADGDIESAGSQLEFTSENVIEENHVYVGQILMKVMVGGVDTISDQEWQELDTIAEQCPLTGGHAIFQARAFILLEDFDRVFANACDTGSSGKRKVPGELKPEVLKQEIWIFPNPATDEVFISVPNEDAIVAIMDLYGHNLHQSKIYGGNIGKISTIDWPRGVYLIRITKGENDVFIFKLILQ